MKITPVDIHHKTFKNQMFGLDKQEVSQFLQEVASQLEIVTLEKNHLKEQLREKEIALMDFKERDKVLNETISTASRMAEKLREEAIKEAANIKKEAELNAQSMMVETREQLKNMYKEIMELKKLKIQFDSNMRAIATAHLEMLEKFNLTHEGVSAANQPASPLASEAHA